MYKFNIDIKTGFIIILGLIIILLLLFKPTYPTDYYKKEIKNLEEKNLKLFKQNDSLNIVNDILNFKINKLNEKVDLVNVILDKNGKEIKRLNNRKNEVFTNVSCMDVNDVTSNIANYIKRRN